MAFVRKQKRGNQSYYYLVESKRVGNKVKQINLQYLGIQKPSKGIIDLMIKKIKSKQME
jgi:hypothetical protein